MNAKEMFEKLGYKLNHGMVYGTYYFDYIKEKDKIKLDGKTYYFRSRIHFDHELKAVSKVCYPQEWYGINMITALELQAINKQMEELGWLDKESNND